MQTIQNHIQNHTFLPVYLLYGEERFRKRQAYTQLKDALCADGDTMNLHTYHGKITDLPALVDLAVTLPFFADYRVMLLTDTGLFHTECEPLVQYFAQPNPSTVFVFNETKIDKRNKLYKTVNKVGHTVELGRLDAAALERAVMGFFKKNKKNIAPDTARLFLDRTGSDMDNIRMELEKLLCYCLEKDTVTRADVEALTSAQASDHIFEMMDLLACGKTKEALVLYYDLLQLRQSPMAIILLLSRHITRLLQIKELMEMGFGEAAIRSKLSLSPWQAGKYIQQAAALPMKSLRTALHKCVRADEAIKTGKMTDRLSAEVLMFSLFDPEDA